MPYRKFPDDYIIYDKEQGWFFEALDGSTKGPFETKADCMTALYDDKVGPVGEPI